MAIPKDFGGPDRLSRRAGMLALNRAMIHYSLGNGIRYWFATMFSQIYRFYAELHIPFLPLSHEHVVWPDENGAATIPALMDLHHMGPYLYFANRELYPEMMQTEATPIDYDPEAMRELRIRIETENEKLYANQP